MRTRPLLSKYFDTGSKQRFTSDSSSPTNPPERGGQIFPLALIQYPGNRANRLGSSDSLPVLQPYASRGDGGLGNFGKENNTFFFCFFRLSRCLFLIDYSHWAIADSQIEVVSAGSPQLSNVFVFVGFFL